jgi:hypothetical protein
MASGSPSAGRAGNVRVWDAHTGQETLTLKGHADMVRSLAFSPDGQRLASASSDGTVKVWDTQTGQEALVLRRRRVDLVSEVQSLAFSPDGRWLALGNDDQTVTVWDAQSGEEIRTFQEGTGPVNSMVFSPDSQRLITASVDGTVKVWDVQTGQDLLTLKGGGSCVAISSDGQRLAAGGVSETVKLWETVPPTPEQVVARQATHLVNELFAEWGLKDVVLEQIRRDPSLSPAFRTDALAYAGRLSSLDPAQLNKLSWAVARQPGLAAPAYQRAVRQAREVCRLDPRNRWYLTTLGVSLYRGGNYAEAVKILTQSDWLDWKEYHSSDPADLAFLAMAHHRLGQEEQAEEVMAQLRRTMKEPSWAKNAEAQDFFREAEALLHRPAARPKQ